MNPGKVIQQIVLIIGMIYLSATTLFCLVRAIIGPRFTDRLLAINVINVKTIVLVCMLALYLGEGYVVDIALVYSAISFLSVIILARIFLLAYLNKLPKDNLTEGDGGSDRNN